jgi:hypothetical protein
MARNVKPYQRNRLRTFGVTTGRWYADNITQRIFAITNTNFFAQEFCSFVQVTQKEVQQDDFQEKVIEVYKTMLPFRRYLNKAVTV